MVTLRGLVTGQKVLFEKVIHRKAPREVVPRRSHSTDPRQIPVRRDAQLRGENERVVRRTHPSSRVGVPAILSGLHSRKAEKPSSGMSMR